MEPDFALVKFKKLAGGGYFKIVNQSVAPALTRLGYHLDEINDIVQYIVGASSIEGAPHVNDETLTEKGFTAEDLEKLEATLPGVFELKHAFNVFTFGEETLQRLGFTVDEYTSWDFDLLILPQVLRCAVDAVVVDQVDAVLPVLRGPPARVAGKGYSLERDITGKTETLKPALRPG